MQEERDVFATILTESLGTIDRLSQRGYFPVATGGNDLFYKIEDGVLLAHFINVVREGTILEKAINMPSRYVSSESEGVSLDGKSSSVGLNHWQKTENLNLVINSAKNIGCQIINIVSLDCCGHWRVFRPFKNSEEENRTFRQSSEVFICSLYFKLTVFQRDNF